MWQILWLFETIRHEKLIEKIEKGYIQTEIENNNNNKKDSMF